jgi:hypothetical protein
MACAAPAAAHGEYDWINKGGYRGVNGDQCCGKDDCYKLEAAQIEQQKDGFHVPSYGVTVPYSDVQRSEDEHYWICRTSARMRCFFAPHQGF